MELETVKGVQSGLTIFRDGALYIPPKENPGKGEKISAKRTQRFIISANVLIEGSTIKVKYGISSCSHKEEKYNWTIGRQKALLREVELSKITDKTDVISNEFTTSTSNVFAFEGIEKKFDLIAQKIYEVGDVREFMKEYSKK